jgi:hypothetical protein
MQKWEYKVVQAILHEEYLNDFGAQGWEVVSVVEGGKGRTLLFKRPLGPGPAQPRLEDEAGSFFS